MTVYITAISPATSQRHEHIAQIRWLSSTDSKSNTMNIARAVAWVRDGNNFTVAGPDGPVAVHVVDANPPYLRTVANNTYTDNLLNLPRF